ncbi:probable dolichyl pyrophosphate Man9GlcNAc2 alpha-1,3-glucosyltransferase isoform X1 [Lactuca sativa]|uniref:probable dolichyl pyrophosphate Man9GlcNAc2 alpha-1,3-glucosyltransferase isoform X1 n=1 Tax=Lactuca sativa TaxID=4236 RepID=UPI000CD958D5|nr:probable dolichyl pyrophosphate Man9GlcNAc2 alpha-1,3-glucosyltransferase isoform X1 [Lactuca sativa]
MEKSRVKKVKKEEVDNNSDWSWLMDKGISGPFICISLFSILVRVSVSMHPYSGAGDSPKYGDFEAQRHWMEITTNLPVNEWYHNSTSNDLAYWGLDYPPLTAYQSYVHGIFLRFFHPDSVSLYTSRGHESYTGMFLEGLKEWNLSQELESYSIVFLWFIIVYASQSKGYKSNLPWHVAMILLNPCLILIDHGHFQYNCISLGLTIGAVAALLCDKDLVASFFFTLALNHKQMSAYFAPAFFSYLLGKSLRCKNPVLEVVKLGIVVIGTFALIWWPYIHSKVAIFEVVSRLAPFERGIYEDYVANFWCTTSVLIKWKKLFTTQSLKLLSLTITLSSCLPSMFLQIKAPSKRGFLYGLLNSAFSFYFFSFQVHEKSILLPLLPASLLAVEEPFLFQWLTQFALFSIFPLLLRDKLLLPYIALYAIFILIHYGKPKPKPNTQKPNFFLSFLIVCLLLLSLVLHVIYLKVNPPKKYPFLFEAIIMLLCFSQFVFIAVYSNRKLWILSRTLLVEIEKKRI